MKKLKFSHKYEKMPKDFDAPTSLMAIFVTDSKDFGEFFTKYDTLYFTDTSIDFYSLPKGKVIVLLLITENHVWTTIRRWTPWKEIYYKGLVGCDLEVVIEKDEKAI